MQSKTNSRRGWLRDTTTLVAGLAISGRGARAQSPAPIVLGHTYPATGIFSDTAAEMKAAIDAAAAAANALGGVSGRPLKVQSLDDGYDAQRSVQNAERLRTEFGAVALVAPVGTSNLAALMPWAERERIPLIGVRSGADTQRSYHRHVFFVIASFGDEVRHIARHLGTIRVRGIALAAMDNATGRSVAHHLAEAARAGGLELASTVFFDPAGKDAGASARQLAASAPTHAILLAGGGEGAIELIGGLIRTGVRASTIYALSLLQPQHVHRRLGDKANGMIFAQVMPRLDDRRFKVAAMYREALKLIPDAPPPSLLGLEAFVAMQVTIRALALIGPAVTGASLSAAVERLGRLDLGGIPLQYDSSSHHGGRYVDLGILARGRVTR